MTKAPRANIRTPDNWRLYLLAAIPVVVLAVAGAVGPVAQPQGYHLFADRRSWLGVPNFANVASNAAFLIAGSVGLFHCIRFRPEGALRSWIVFFCGVALVSVGSAYYHWSPTDRTLVWDRLPMTMGFMGVYVALLTEFVDRRLERFLLIPAALAGIGSVAYWAISGDLRFYIGVQVLSLVSSIAIVLSFRNPHRQNRYLAAAFVCYALAVSCERFDHGIFATTHGVVGGHTLKHLFAAVAPLWIYLMLRARGQAASSGGLVATKNTRSERPVL